MPAFITKNRARIRETIDFLAVNRLPITVEIEAELTLYDSTILKADHGNPHSKTGAGGRVFIQWLFQFAGGYYPQSVV
jgi:hypothetical protein